MDTSFYLGLAAQGLRMPIGTHLVLHRYADTPSILLDGKRLGEVVCETASRFGTPLAFPLMDLSLEKECLLSALGVPASDIEHFHFDAPPQAPASLPATPRMRATCDAITHVATQPALVPVGMCIGPFSLMTKLLADPITPVFMAGTGLGPEDEPEIALLHQVLALGERVITSYIQAQIAAGAKALIVCEPAANLVYFSPNQLAQSHALFDQLVMDPMRRIAALLASHDVDLIFHDCGELTEGMLTRFATLGAKMVSLGSSRRLWEDAALFPKDTVLFGNLPSKRFYARQLSADEVTRQSAELLARMHAAKHPFILGSECDVLSVPGSEDEILSKVQAFMRCTCAPCTTAP